MLRQENDLWVATADADGGGAYLVPLSFHWDGTTVLLATPAASPTGRNLAADGRVRVGVGVTRDVCMIDGSVSSLPMADLAQERAEAFVAHTGFDPRTLQTPYRWYLVSPTRVQAWREADELAGRDLMRDGRWLA